MSLLDKKLAKQYDNASTQINVPKAVADQIHRIGQELIPDEHLAGDGRVEVLHVTVKYGVQPDERTFRQAIAGRTAFPVTLGNLVTFPDAESEGTPVVIEVHGHEFEALHDSIAQAMGTLPDEFAYTPHITVAYVNPKEAQHYAGNDSFSGIEFEAEAVTLSMFDDDNQVDVPLAKAAASPAQVMPEIPQVAPEILPGEEPEEEVQRDEPATQQSQQEEEALRKAREWAKKHAPKQKTKLLQPKQPKWKAPKKPPVETTNFKKWFGKSKIRDDDGKPLRVYHGTTHDFEEFDLRKTNVENYYGQGFYFTSDQTDVGSNYATDVGPDITSRVENRAERIFQDMQEEWDDLHPDEEFPSYSSDEYQELMANAKREAKYEIAGQSKGMTMPVYLSIQNPVVVQKNGGTQFELEIDDDGNESGNGVDLYNAMMRVASSYHTDAQSMWSSIIDNRGESFNAWDFEKAVRESGEYVEDSEGNIAAGSFISDVYQEMGFDGIIQDANEAFGGGSRGKAMDMDYDTKHYIIWDATKVKSAIGNPGKFDPKNPNITAAVRNYPGTEEWINRAKEFLKEKWALRHTEMGREGVPTDLSGACKFASLFAQQLFGGQIKGNPEHQVLKRMDRIIDLTDIFDPNTFYHDKEFFENPEHEESMASCLPRVQQWVAEFKQKYPLEDKIATGETGVGDLGKIKKIMHELMPVLGEQLPDPEVKLVNAPRAGWYGRDTWHIGVSNGQPIISDNTTIEIQKSILNDDNTLRRVIAHELCHHADALINGVEEMKKVHDKWTYESFLRSNRGHGSGWSKYAQKYNAKFGADFVTEKSDEAYVSEELELKPYHILLERNYDGKLGYEVSSRLSPKQKRYLDRLASKKDGYEHRLTQTNDQAFFKGHLIGSFYFVHPKDDETQQKLEELWGKAKPIEPTGAAKEQDSLLKLMRERMTGPGWQRTPKKSAVPEIQELEHGVSKDYDRVRWVYQQFYDNGIQSMSWKDFQQKFPKEQNSPLFTQVRQNRPTITLEDMDRWMEEYNTKAKDYQNYELEHGTYRDEKTSFRDVEQLVLRVNQSASAAAIIGEDEMMKVFLDNVTMGSQHSGHPVGENTVGWLRVDFINDDWLLVDEVQSDLINAVELAKRFIIEPTLESLMSKYKSETVKQKIHDMGANETMFQNSKREFARRGYTVEKFDEMKQSLANLFKDWAEYGIASLIEIARRHGIKNVAIHTGETIAKRDPDIEAEKVVMYYDQLAKSMGFKKQQLDIGDLKGNFWVRTAASVSPKLKTWFDGSKVVDKNGNPRVVYHGSRSTWLTQFDLGREGTGVHGATKWGAIWFTSSAENAEEYADQPEEKVEANLDEIVPYGNDPFYAAVYDINEKSLFQVGPYPTEEEAEREALAQAKEYNKHLDKNTNVMGVYLRIANPLVTENVPRDAEFKAAKEGGHDGIIAYDVVDGFTRSDVFVIFDPKQAKSADRNVGTYDPNSISLTAGKRDEAVTSMTVGVDLVGFPSPLLIRWEQGMRWRAVLKAVKVIVGEVAEHRVAWRDIHIWASLWENQQTQQEGWLEERTKGTHVMYDILHNGSFVSVGKPMATAAGAEPEVLTASHKTPPLSDTMYNSPEIGEETNAYADIPERVRGTYDVPPLQTLAPQMFKESGSNDLKSQLEALRPQMAAAAQEIYDAWDQGGYRSSEGGDIEFGEGGICDSIAREIGGIVASNIETEVADGGQDGDDHAWTIAHSGSEVYGIDIPHEMYERGGGYSWTKVPGVTFSADDVQIFPMDIDPSEFAKEGAANGVEYRIEVMDSHGGELFCQAEAWLGDDRIGVVYFNESEARVDWSGTRYYREGEDEYGGKEWERIADLPREIWIKNVEVKPKYRRQGIATGMYEKIKQEFPGEKITSSGTTDEGTPFREKLVERGVLAYKSALLKRARLKDGTKIKLVEVEGGDAGGYGIGPPKTTRVPQLKLPMTVTAVFGEAQNQVQHTDHTPQGMTKTLKSNPFSEELEILHESLGQDKPEVNPSLEDNTRAEGQPPAKGEDKLQSTTRTGAVKTSGLRGTLEYHRSGETLWIDMFALQPKDRGKGGGRIAWQEFESSIPQDIELIRIFAGDTGAGISTGFWAKMGFTYVYDQESGTEYDQYMWKGVNGHPTPPAFKETPDEEHGYDIVDQPEKQASASNHISGEDPVQIEREAEAYENQMKPGEPGAGYADEFNWAAKDIPVAKIEGDPKMWEKWFKQEIEWAHEGGRGNYYEQMEKWWMSNPDEHIIVVLDKGKYYIWEGNHRVAIAKIRGMKMVPAFVGVSKYSKRASSNRVSGEDVVSYVQKLNKWDRQTAYQVVGLDAGGDYILTPEYDLDKLEAGDDYDPVLAERYAKMKTPFPPIVLNIEGKIQDGNHRVAGAKLRGDTYIAAYEPLDTYDPSENK